MDAPNGRVTLGFTDIQGSTRLWEDVPSSMLAALDVHDAWLRRCLAEHAGYEVKTEGDAFMVAFHDPSDAVRWAIAVQVGLPDQPWPTELLAHPTAAPADGLRGPRVRIGLHLGRPHLREDPVTGRADYFGPVVNRAARISGAAHGGQTVASTALVDALPAALRRHGRELGAFHLRGLEQAETIWQLDTPGRPRRFPPLRTPRRQRHNLPQRHDAFFGREPELRAVVDAFDDGARVVTLKGAGGVGKTRMSQVCARQLAERFPGGAWFCDLAEARDTPAVLGAVAGPLGLRVGGDDPAEALGRDLASLGPLVLVLDNLEQVIGPAADVVATWRRLAPELRMLGTSRSRLGVTGERVVDVAPLPVPDDDDSAFDAPSVRLLLARARATTPRWGQGALGDVAATVRLLDGMPLALELAAARASLLTAPDLRRRLEQRIEVLPARRHGPRRHATLAATLKWSWDLLPPWGRSALAQCAVFEGSFPVHAAEAVIDLSTHPEAPPALEALQTLVDDSLLTVEGESSAGRLRMLATIRAFADSRLDDLDLREGAEARHDAWFLGQVLAARAAPRRREALRTDVDDLLAAARRLPDDDAAETIALIQRLALTGTTWAGADEASERLLGGADLDPRVRALLRAAWGASLRVRGRRREAERLLRVARNEADTLDAALAGALAWHGLGLVAHDEARTADALAHYHRARALAERVGDPELLSRIHVCTANAHRELGQVRRAAEVFALGEQEGLRASRRALAIALANVALLDLDVGRPGEARRTLHRSLDLCRELGDVLREVMNLANIAGSYAEEGRAEPQWEHMELARALVHRIVSPRIHAIVLALHGRAAMAVGRLDEAEAELREALGAMQALRQRDDVAMTRADLGELRARRGHVEAGLAEHDEALRDLLALDNPLEAARLLRRRRSLLRDLGRDAEAEALDTRLEDLARRLGVPPSRWVDRGVHA